MNVYLMFKLNNVNGMLELVQKIAIGCELTEYCEYGFQRDENGCEVSPCTCNGKIIKIKN